MKRCSLAFLFLIFYSSYGISQNKIREMKTEVKDMILNYEEMLQDSIDKPVLVIPTNAVWEKDRDEFVNMIEDYKSKNEKIRKKTSNTSLGFTITGTVVGIGGGIYGLFSNSEPKGAAFTSLIAGSLTGLLGSLNIQKKTERAFACSDFLEGILLDFKIYWGAARCPATQEELKGYLKEKDQIISSLKSMKCYGLVEH